MENNNKPNKLQAFLKSRKTKHGIISILLTVIFIAAIVGINVATVMLTNRVPALTTDLTKNKVFKLNEVTVEQLNKLNEDVNIYVLGTEEELELSSDYHLQVNKLLHEIDKTSDHITLKYVDSDTDPTFASRYSDVNWRSTSIMTDPFLIVEHGDNYIAATYSDIFVFDQEAIQYNEYNIIGQNVEQAILSATLFVTTEEKPKVSVLELNYAQDVDVQSFMALLARNAYEIDSLSLSENKDVPEDTDFIVIFTPTNDINEATYQKLSDWLYNDGKYGHNLFYVPYDISAGELTNLNKLLEEWGMAITQGYVFETDVNYMSTGDYPNSNSRYDYDNTTFSNNLSDTSKYVYMKNCMPIELLNSNASSLLSTSDSAVVYPFTADTSWTAESAEHKNICGAAISTKLSEDTKSSSNIVVVGSYQAFFNEMLSWSSINNSAFFLNIFNTLSQRDSSTTFITVEGKTLEPNELGLTSMGTLKTLTFIVRYLVPLAVIIAGVVVWLRRRNK